MRATMMMWLILAFICCGLTRATDGVSSHGQGSGDKGMPITPPDSLRLHNPRDSDRRLPIQTTGGISLSGSHSSIRRPPARAAGGPGSQAARDSDKRFSAQTTTGGSWRSSRGPGLPPDERIPSYDLHGDDSGLFLPPMEDVGGNGPADPWDNQDRSGQSWRTDARAGGIGNQDAQCFPPAKPRATAPAKAEPGPPNGNTTALENDTGVRGSWARFQSWITGALALAAVLLPALLAVRSIRAGHTRRARTASRSRRGQQVQSSPPMILTGLLMQKPPRHDQVVDATHQGEPTKTRRAA